MQVRDSVFRTGTMHQRLEQAIDDDPADERRHPCRELRRPSEKPQADPARDAQDGDGGRRPETADEIRDAESKAFMAGGAPAPGVIAAPGLSYLLRSLSPVECLAYTLSMPVHVAVCGAGTQGQMEDNIRVAQSFKPLSEADLAAVRQRAVVGQGVYTGTTMEYWKKPV